MDFGKTITARYICIESLSSHSKDNNASIAEIHLMDADGKLLDSNGWQVIYADSEEIVAEPASVANVIDEQPVTIWHTKYEGEGANTPHPHQIVIDLGGVQSFRSLRYLPRSGANHGKIKGDVDFGFNPPCRHGKPWLKTTRFSDSLSGPASTTLGNLEGGLRVVSPPV